jgi:hypothetical protein
MRADYTFFSAAYGAFAKTDHIIEHKTNLKKYKKFEIIPCILTNHNGIKLKTNSRENHKNHLNSCRKAIYDKPIASIILNREKPTIPSKIRN